MPLSLSYDQKCKGEILGLEKHISQSDMMQFPGNFKDWQSSPVYSLVINKIEALKE